MGIIRSESHALQTNATQRADVARTIAHYRRVVRALAGVILVHWPELGPLPGKGKCAAIEALFHTTKQRPLVRYPVLDRICARMPSYLRRAAIEAAFGLVSSYLENYSNFLDGTIGGKPRAIGARPPRLGLSNVYPPLYGGNMLLADPGMKAVRIKLLGHDGQWRFTARLAVRGRLRRLPGRMDLCPALIQAGAKVRLSCPVELRPPKPTKTTDVRRVCAVDVGINTAATAAIVDATGTVIARRFLTCGRHNDQRDALARQVAAKQSRSGDSHYAGRGFCRSLYRRIAGLSLDAARQLGHELVEFARKHDAQVLVIEQLKGWRPKGGHKAQRPRFHRFQHRMLVKSLALKAEEFGLRLLEVWPGGTSRWAYDGSGKVRRDPKNAQLATFAGGKRYNADLNGALNIAARGLALLFGIKAGTGKRSGPDARMPLVLADVWAHAQTLRGPSNRPAQAGKGFLVHGLAVPDAPTTAQLRCA